MCSFHLPQVWLWTISSDFIPHISGLPRCLVVAGGCSEWLLQCRFSSVTQRSASQDISLPLSGIWCYKRLARNNNWFFTVPWRTMVTVLLCFIGDYLSIRLQASNLYAILSVCVLLFMCDICMCALGCIYIYVGAYRGQWSTSCITLFMSPPLFPVPKWAAGDMKLACSFRHVGSIGF